MGNEPVVEERGDKHYAGIPIKVNLAEWGKANALIPELYQWLAGRNITPGGGPIYRYYVVGDHEQEFDLEIGVPVAAPVPGDGRVSPGVLPAGRYAVTVHHGHPDGQEHSHAELQDWATGQGLAFDRTSTGAWTARYETYLTNPDEEPDPNKWSTEIAYLLGETS